MTAAPDSDQDDEADRGDPAYAYKPSLVGAPCEFVLKPDALHWQIGRRAGRLRYDRVRRVRLSYRPVTMQSHRFVTEIWSSDNPKIQIASVSWRSLVEQGRLDAPYAAFIVELHRRLAAAGTAAQFSAGLPVAVYWIGVGVFAAVMVAIGVLTVRAMQAGQWSGAALVGLFFVVFAYQLGNYFRRNRPGRYRPDALPPNVLPRV
jgi:hypothetical protein